MTRSASFNLDLTIMTGIYRLARKQVFRDKAIIQIYFSIRYIDIFRKEGKPIIMLNPDQFHVNEAWIAVRVNEAFLFVKDEPYDIYVLMDAASAYVLSHVLSRVVDEAPHEKDIEVLFKKAWEAKNQWAEKLILTENSIAEDVFRTEAEKNGISVKIVPLSDLEPIVGPLKESFASGFMGSATQ